MAQGLLAHKAFQGLNSQCELATRQRPLGPTPRANGKHLGPAFGWDSSSFSKFCGKFLRLRAFACKEPVAGRAGVRRLFPQCRLFRDRRIGSQLSGRRSGIFPSRRQYARDPVNECIALRALIDHGSRDNRHLFGRIVCLLDGNSRVADHSLGNSKSANPIQVAKIPLGVLAGAGHHFQTAIRASPYVVVT